MPPPRPQSRQSQNASGLVPRNMAVAALAAIFDRGRTLDEAFDAAVAKGEERHGALEPRDRAFARLIVMTVLRRKGEFEAVVRTYIERPLPADSGRLWLILLVAAAQLLDLDTPPHAAISLAVDQCRGDRRSHRFAGLTNAVLRRVATTGKDVLGTLDPVAVNIPDWMLARWQAAYGAELARAIAAASLQEAALDLSVKSDASAWAERLGGIVLPTGTVRLPRVSRVDALQGFAEGAWWVQDAAAALPARLLGDVAGLRIADLCAAPGGKTAELAIAGAKVAAVDVSGERLRRLRDNLARLKLDAEIVETDVTTWQPDTLFDAVLLDAPCSATGTLRRHPDILHLKRKDDTSERITLQRRMLASAARLVRPGGRLVYCTCSLEPEEGAGQIAELLADGSFVREPVAAGESGIDAAWISPEGDLRTLPSQLERPEPGMSGMDGFFAARLRKS